MHPSAGSLTETWCADFDATAEWRDMDWVQVRSNQGHASHVLRMDKYQVSRRASPKPNPNLNPKLTLGLLGFSRARAHGCAECLVGARRHAVLMPTLASTSIWHAKPSRRAMSNDEGCDQVVRPTIFCYLHHEA